MKLLLCILIAGLAVLVPCGACVADDEREAKPRVKGVELYSWMEKGDWEFVLLSGTNRIKTEAEVKAAKTKVKGVQDLKTALGRLAVGEMVFWSPLVKGFEFPPRVTRDEIEKAAKEAKVDLKILGPAK